MRGITSRIAAIPIAGLGKATIAEFVEDAPTQQLLRDYGVDFAQGYHVGRPLDVLQLRPGACAG